MNLTKKILEDLSAPLSEGGLSMGELIYHPYKILQGDLKKLYNERTVQKSLLRSEKANLIEKRKIRDKTYMALTELGKEKLSNLRKRIEINVEPNEEEWDGKYRLVLFDIPEKNRAVRDLLRTKLKELEFVGWQKSVWVGKQMITEELRDFFKGAGLEDYAIVIETHDLGNNKLKYFMSMK